MRKSLKESKQMPALSVQASYWELHLPWNAPKIIKSDYFDNLHTSIRTQLYVPQVLSVRSDPLALTRKKSDEVLHM